MKVRLTALVLTILFLTGNVQASVPSDSHSKSHELKIAPLSFVKSLSSEKSLGEDEFTHYPAAIHLNFKTTFTLRAIQRPVFSPSFTHKPSQFFILYRVLRN